MKEKKGSGFLNVIRNVGKWTFTLRSLFLAIPVAAVAVILALRNSFMLPAVVSFDIALVESQKLVFRTVAMGRGTAVILPLMITLGCLVLTFCSKKVLYPWLISIFSLILPIVLLIVNTFP